MHSTKIENHSLRNNFSALVLLMYLSAGCRHHNAINFATNTQFGVKVGVNADKIPQVNIGYDRQEAARVPVHVEGTNVAVFSPSSVPGLLLVAKKELEAGNYKTANRLLRHAKSLDSESGTLSPIIGRLVLLTAADPLQGDDKAESSALISAELESRRAQWSGEFAATRNGSNSKDALSVLGTFSGDGSGTGASNDAGKVKIAQFFATGVAAQLLALQGGAATVNPFAESPAKVAEELDAKTILSAQIKEADSKREKLSKELSDRVDRMNSTAALDKAGNAAIATLGMTQKVWDATNTGANDQENMAKKKKALLEAIENQEGSSDGEKYLIRFREELNK